MIEKFKNKKNSVYFLALLAFIFLFFTLNGIFDAFSMAILNRDYKKLLPKNEIEKITIYGGEIADVIVLEKDDNSFSEVADKIYSINSSEGFLDKMSSFFVSPMEMLNLSVKIVKEETIDSSKDYHFKISSNGGLRYLEMRYKVISKKLYVNAYRDWRDQEFVSIVKDYDIDLSEIISKNILENSLAP